MIRRRTAIGVAVLTCLGAFPGSAAPEPQSSAQAAVPDPRCFARGAVSDVEISSRVAFHGDTQPPAAARKAAATERRAAQTVFRSVARRLRPCLVRIDTVGGTQPRDPRTIRPRDPGAPERPAPSPFRDAVGSSFTVADGPTTGLIYAADGYIVTSGFNFVRRPALISVTLANGTRLAADLIASDHVRKIALLKLDAHDLPVPTWTTLDTVRVGRWAIALGAALSGDGPAVTRGIISATGRMHGYAVQTDAKLSPANYGGPLCDIDGHVIGLCVPMAQRPGELAGIDMYDSGVGFAIPKHHLDDIVARLMTGESIHRGWLGIQADPAHPGAVIIKRIADPSPMRDAGARPGDRIVRIEDTAIDHFGHVIQALYMTPAGQAVHMELRRDGIPFGITVVLARAAELGPLPDTQEPFDPSQPFFPPPNDQRPR